MPRTSATRTSAGYPSTTRAATQSGHCGPNCCVQRVGRGSSRRSRRSRRCRPRPGPSRRTPGTAGHDGLQGRPGVGGPARAAHCSASTDPADPSTPTTIRARCSPAHSVMLLLSALWSRSRRPAGPGRPRGGQWPPSRRLPRRTGRPPPPWGPSGGRERASGQPATQLGGRHLADGPGLRRPVPVQHRGDVGEQAAARPRRSRSASSAAVRSLSTTASTPCSPPSPSATTGSLPPPAQMTVMPRLASSLIMSSSIRPGLPGRARPAARTGPVLVHLPASRAGGGAGGRGLVVDRADELGRLAEGGLVHFHQGPGRSGRPRAWLSGRRAPPRGPPPHGPPRRAARHRGPRPGRGPGPASSRSSPGSAPPARRTGRGATATGHCALCDQASTPTCGPFPCVMTRS